jgi:hypothetical protein
MLALHPGATWFSQYSQRDGSVSGRRRLPLAHPVDRPHQWRKETQGLRRLIPRPGEVHTILLYVLAAPTQSEAAGRLRRVVDDECRRWRRAVLLAKPLPLRGRLDLLEAEDLCADVHRALARALEHAGLDPNAFPFDRVPATLVVTNQGRLDELAPDELEAVQGAQEPVLRRLGYLGAQVS